MNLSAPALPLILTFSPAAKIAAGEKGKDMRLRSVLAGPETRRVRGPNISAAKPWLAKKHYPNRGGMNLSASERPHPAFSRRQRAPPGKVLSTDY
jgi:hypothetical protein